MSRRSGWDGIEDLATGQSPSIKVAGGELDDAFYVMVTEQPEGGEDFRGVLAVRWDRLGDWVYRRLHEAGLPSLGDVSVRTIERLDSGLSFRARDLEASVFLAAKVVLAEEGGDREAILRLVYESGDGGGWMGAPRG